VLLAAISAELLAASMTGTSRLQQEALLAAFDWQRFN
jgi:hypothetical protein